MAARDFTAALPGLESDVSSHMRSLLAAHIGRAIDALVGFRGAAAAREVEAALGFGGATDPLLASVGFEAALIAGDAMAARTSAARAETHVGEALVHLGDAPKARAQLEAALQHFTEQGAGESQDTAYVHRSLGLLALRERDDAAAEAALTRALALWAAEPCGCRDAAEAQLGLAALLARRGDARAPALRSAADAFFSPLGAEAIAHRDRVVALIVAPLLEDPEEMP